MKRKACRVDSILKYDRLTAALKVKNKKITESFASRNPMQFFFRIERVLVDSEDYVTDYIVEACAEAEFVYCNARNFLNLKNGNAYFTDSQ